MFPATVLPLLGKRLSPLAQTWLFKINNPLRDLKQKRSGFCRPDNYRVKGLIELSYNKWTSLPANERRFEL